MNPIQGDDLQAVELFRKTKTIVIVGMSADPSRASHGVGNYLASYYKIIPVNPDCEAILGYPCYPSISAITEPVDFINIFQRSERVALFVEEAIAKKPAVFWMQLGIRSPEAKQALLGAGITVVEDKCTKIEHARLTRMGLL
jgi:predicted CoA-binding protein